MSFIGFVPNMLEFIGKNFQTLETLGKTFQTFSEKKSFFFFAECKQGATLPPSALGIALQVLLGIRIFASFSRVAPCIAQCEKTLKMCFFSFLLASYKLQIAVKESSSEVSVASMVRELCEGLTSPGVSHAAFTLTKINYV